eukprot:comp20025_c0_seq1/m.24575 comp20025_c0_seq1/g.24575  ORF comp20025_c0_seq1/g.24575 comp20025_c0_seq1/m.24575 type:complete len:755 (-) comp20025_c0_seq1:561-2825(-)
MAKSKPSAGGKHTMNGHSKNTGGERKRQRGEDEETESVNTWESKRTRSETSDTAKKRRVTFSEPLESVPKKTPSPQDFQPISALKPTKKAPQLPEKNPRSRVPQTKASAKAAQHRDTDSREDAEDALIKKGSGNRKRPIEETNTEGDVDETEQPNMRRKSPALPTGRLDSKGSKQRKTQETHKRGNSQQNANPVAPSGENMIPFDLLSGETLDLDPQPNLFDQSSLHGAVFNKWVTTRHSDVTLDKPNAYQTGIKEQRARLNQVNLRLLEERDSLLERVEGLQRQLEEGGGGAEGEAELERLREELRGVGAERVKVVKAAAAREKELQAEVTKATAQLEKLKVSATEKLDKLKERLAEREAQWKEREEEMGRKERETEERQQELEDRLKSTETERDELKKKIGKQTQESEKKAGKELEKERKAWEKEREKWEKQREKEKRDWEKEKAELQKEKDGLEKELNRLEEEREELRKEQGITEKGIEKLKRETMKELKGKDDEIMVLTRDAKMLREEVEKERKQRQKDNNMWEKEEEKWEKELEKEKSKEQKLEKELEKAKNKETKLGNELSKHEDLERELRKKLAAAEKVKQRLGEEVTRRKKEEQRAQKSLEAAEARVAQLQKEVKLLTKKTKLMEEDITSIEQDAEDAQNWAEAEQQRLKQLREAHDVMGRLAACRINRVNADVFTCNYRGLENEVTFELSVHSTSDGLEVHYKPNSSQEALKALPDFLQEEIEFPLDQMHDFFRQLAGCDASDKT